MVTVVRTGAIAPGKTAEALTFAHQISKLIKEKHGVTIELLVPVAGIRPNCFQIELPRPGRMGRLSRQSSWPTLITVAAITSNSAVSCLDRSTTKSGGRSEVRSLPEKPLRHALPRALRTFAIHSLLASWRRTFSFVKCAFRAWRGAGCRDRSLKIPAGSLDERSTGSSAKRGKLFSWRQYNQDPRTGPRRPRKLEPHFRSLRLKLGLAVIPQKVLYCHWQSCTCDRTGSRETMPPVESNSLTRRLVTEVYAL